MKKGLFDYSSKVDLKKGTEIYWIIYFISVIILVKNMAKAKEKNLKFFGIALLKIYYKKNLFILIKKNIFNNFYNIIKNIKFIIQLKLIFK